MKSRSGFSIVEVGIVIVVIGILATIGTISYFHIQKQQRDAQLENSLTLISSAQERYRQENGEYLSSRQLAGNGNSGNNLTDYQYQQIAQMLKVDPLILKNAPYKFVPSVAAVGLMTPTSKHTLYLLTKDITNASVYNFNIGSSGCRVTFPVDLNPTARGTTAYVLTYFSELESRWIINKSAAGDVEITQTSSTPSQSCIFD